MSCRPPRLREGDLARTHVAAHLGRRLVFDALPMPERLFAELFEIEVVCPTGFLPHLAGERDQLSVPAAPVREGVSCRHGPAAADQSKLAVEEIDLASTRPWLPSAMDARRWCSHDLLAGRTLA